MLLATDANRLELWKISWEAFRHHPEKWLFGWGPDNFLIPFRLYRTQRLLDATNAVYVQHQAHNLILQLLTTTGIIGTLAAGYLLYALWKGSSRRGKAALGGLLAVAMVEPIPFQAWALLALLLGAEWQGYKAYSFSAGKWRWTAFACLIGTFSLWGSEYAWWIARGQAYKGDRMELLRWAYYAGAINPTSINALQAETQLGSDTRSRLRLFHPHDSSASQLSALAARMHGEDDRPGWAKAKREDPLNTMIPTVQ